MTLYVPTGTLKILNFPSASVDAPNEVPSTNTFVPANGSPVSASITVPDIFPFIPAKTNVGISIKIRNRLNCFIVAISYFSMLAVIGVIKLSFSAKLVIVCVTFETLILINSFALILYFK